MRSLRICCEVDKDVLLLYLWKKKQLWKGPLLKTSSVVALNTPVRQSENTGINEQEKNSTKGAVRGG